MDSAPETYPDLTMPFHEYLQTASTKKQFFFYAGPSFRTAQGDSVNVAPSEALRVYPRLAAIRLDNLPVNGYQLRAEDGHVKVKLHFRFLNPEDVMVLMNPARSIIIDPGLSETAMLVAPFDAPYPNAPLGGDTQIVISDTTTPAYMLNDCLQAIGRATGMGPEVLCRDRFMYAVFAECALLRERFTLTHFETIRSSLCDGSWWLRVYLVEIKGDAGNKWTTKAPSQAAHDSIT